MSESVMVVFMFNSKGRLFFLEFTKDITDPGVVQWVESIRTEWNSKFLDQT